MMTKIFLFQILLLGLYIIDSQCIPKAEKKSIASKNDMLIQELRNFSSDVDDFKYEFESNITEVMSSFWFSLKEFSKNESQRLAEEKGIDDITPFCYQEYIEQLMYDLRGIFMIGIQASCSTEGIVKVVRNLLTMERYVQVINALLDSIDICHVKGNELPEELIVKNGFCDYTKHHFNIEILLRELEDRLSNLKRNSVEDFWLSEKMCFENTNKQVQNKLTDIFPVILTECKRAGNYTNMLKILSLFPVSMNKFIPSVEQEKIDEETVDFKLLESTAERFDSIHLVEEYEDMMRNEVLFRRLMAAIQVVEEIQKNMGKRMVSYHDEKYNETATVVETMIQVEDRDGKCDKGYIPYVLGDLRQYYDAKLAPKCLEHVFKLSHVFQLLPQLALHISDKLLTMPSCKPVWECDEIEAQIIDMEDATEYWGNYSTTKLMTNVGECYDKAREVVQDNALRNRHKMQKCETDIELMENMFYYL